jgi:hypothetical protein
LVVPEGYSQPRRCVVRVGGTSPARVPIQCGRQMIHGNFRGHS